MKSSLELQAVLAPLFMQLRTWLYLRDVVKFGSRAIELRGSLTAEQIAAGDLTYFAMERLLFVGSFSHPGTT